MGSEVEKLDNPGGIGPHLLCNVLFALLSANKAICITSPERFSGIHCRILLLLSFSISSTTFFTCDCWPPTIR
jgi:hypothetical protein